MRDKKRIERILYKIGILWKKYPDMRLGQLLENYVFGHHSTRKQCIFHQEDDVTERKLKERLKVEKLLDDPIVFFDEMLKYQEAE